MVTSNKTFILNYIDELIKQYSYKKLPNDLSIKVRNLYLKDIPLNTLNIINRDINFKIFSLSNTLISIGYDRIVIGDYGAFIEINPNSIIKENN